VIFAENLVDFGFATAEDSSWKRSLSSL